VTTLRVALCQLNPVVGDLEGNADLVLEALGRAEAEGCHLAVFGELVITGYPPEDLLLKPGFVVDNRAALDRVAAATGDCVAIVGFVDAVEADARPDEPGERALYNAAAICANGSVVGVYRKRLLPNYAVFDEERYFAPGTETHVLYEVGGAKVGVTICEDAWSASGPIPRLAAGGAQLIANLNGSPYYRGRLAEREKMLSGRSAGADCPIVYVNQVGGQDELIFDGGSLVFDGLGALVTRSPQFVEEVRVLDLDLVPRTGTEPLTSVPVTPARPAPGPVRRPEPAPALGSDAEVYEALVLGTRDYVVKNGFTDVVIGLSGGIDSSIVAAIAADALGPDRVHGVLMPSRFSSDHSVSDAEALGEALGIEHRTIPIEAAHAGFESMLAESFTGRAPDLTEENLQSRVRGTVLMALSNKFGWLVLSTSNKSEAAVGYATLYGDTVGGYSVIKDVPKLLVYDLCRYRNQRALDHGAPGPVIPEHVLTKPPSAELRPDQRDDQSLPPYEVLVPILEEYVEKDRTAAQLVAEGYDPALVARVSRLVDKAEYKRRQSPPGPRVTRKAFGKDRRLPITNRYAG
jgi:NAD+ synthase (glutamine-hydrolysing)